LKKWLNPANVGASDRDAAAQRHPGTGLWLLEECAEFREWMHAPNSFLWLHGISGSGKTVLSSTIIETLRGRSELFIFFYFDTNNSNQCTITHLLCSLVMQLSVQLPSQDQTLYTLWKSHASGEQGLPSESALISKALIPLLKEFTKPIYIVLDALDECSDRREKLLDSIAAIVEAQLSNVRLIVTSRPEVRFNAGLAECGVSVSLDSCVDRDIESYVDAILSKEAHWTAEKKDEIKTKLVKQGGGMSVLSINYRHRAHSMVQVPSCLPPAHVTKALSDMPTSLPDIYDRILQNVKAPDMVSNVCRTINWLTVCGCPMELTALIDALAFDFDKKPLRFNADERTQPEALIAACAGFVSVSPDIYDNTKSMVKIAHASVTDYFISGKGLKDSIEGYCEVSPQSAHFLVARTCLAYLCSFDRVIDYGTAHSDYPLALYAANEW
ncbi:hypothetical protein GGX14DRAFT_335748, partial [Mycena pura]